MKIIYKNLKFYSVNYFPLRQYKRYLYKIPSLWNLNEDNKINKENLSGFELQLLELSQLKEADKRLNNYKYIKNKSQNSLRKSNTLRPVHIVNTTSDSEDITQAHLLSLQSASTSIELMKVINEIFKSEQLNSLLVAESINRLSHFGEADTAYALMELFKRRGVLTFLEICNSKTYTALAKCVWENYKEASRVVLILNEMEEFGLKIENDLKLLVNDIQDYLFSVGRTDEAKIIENKLKELEN